MRWRSNPYRFTHAGLCVTIQNACTLVHFHGPADKTSSGWRISQITTEQHWSTAGCSFSLPLCACAANHYIWRLVCLHSSVMVDGRASPSFVCESALGKQTLSYSTWLALFIWSWFRYWLSITEWRNLSCVLFACDRMRAIIKDRRLPSVCFAENIVTSCCCCDFAVNQPFFEALLPAMKKIHPNTVEPITSFVQAK